MNVVKKMDDIGRIAIPKDLRRSLRWMGGDEIEIVANDDNSITLKKKENDVSKRLRDLCAECADDAEVEQRFLELIELIESKN